MTANAKELLDQIAKMQFRIANIVGLEMRLRALEAGLPGGGGTTDHSRLTHLGYAEAGHTGFQPALGFTPVPAGRLVAGHPLSADVTLSKADVGLANVPNVDTTNAFRSLNDGRLVHTSDTVLSWDGCSIGLWDGTSWVQVMPATTPVLTNTGNDLDGGAITYEANYDVYTAFVSAAAFDLVVKKWTDNTTRAVEPALWQGRYVYDASHKDRLWLGTIRLRNDGGVPKFTDSPTQGYISNFHNPRLRVLRQVISGNGWSYNGSAWRPANNDPGNKVALVLGRPQLVDVMARHNTLTSAGYNTNAETGIGLDATTVNAAVPWASSGYNSPVLTAVEAILIDTLTAGYHYLCPLERSDAGLNASFSSWGKGTIIVRYQS